MPDNTIDYLAHHGLIGQKDDLVSNIELDDNFLEHYQIKGAKHGIRRFQNYDGSLTPAGRERYGIGPAREAKKEKAVAKAAKKAEKKAAAEADAREKLKDYLRKHPKKLPAYGKVLSKEEATEVIDKIKFDRQLKDIRDNEIQSGWKKVQNVSTNIKTVSDFITNGKNLYNNTAEIYNALVDTGVIKSGKKLQKVGEAKKEDRSLIDSIVRTGTAQQVFDNRKSMSSKELEDAIKRLNYEEQLRTKHKVKG